MSDVTFYYVPDPCTDNVTGEKIEILRPKIPIRISLNHKMFPQTIEALFDTGSDRNLFPSGLLTEFFRVKLENKKLLKIGGIGNNLPIAAYTHKVKIYVGSYGFDTEIDFSDKQSQPILGRIGFMDKFSNIELNEKKKYVKLILP